MALDAQGLGLPDHLQNPQAQIPDPITPQNIQGFLFDSFRKKTLTKISSFTVPPGYRYETPEGLKAEDEETRIAIDSQGGVYPIRESVFKETYEKAGE